VRGCAIREIMLTRIRDARGSILAVTRLASEPSCIKFDTVRPIVLGFRVMNVGSSFNHK
jgi:hypothetical protein